MAVAMVMASGIFVTTQSFKANEESIYGDENGGGSEDTDAGESNEDETTEGEATEGDSLEEASGEEPRDDEAGDEASEEVSGVEADTEEGVSAGETETGTEASEESESDAAEATAGDIVVQPETKAVKVVFEINGGEGETPDEMEAEVSEEGDIRTELPELADYTDGNGASHTFVGWSTEQDASEPQDDITVSPDDTEVSLYAVWKLAEPETEAAKKAQEEQIAAEAAKNTEEQAAAEAVKNTEEQAAAEAAKAAEEQAAAEAAKAAEEQTAAATKAAEEQVAVDAKDSETVDTKEKKDEVKDRKGSGDAAAENDGIAQQLTPEELAAQQQADPLATYVPGQAFGTSGDVSVSASWGEGVFPEGTSMQVEQVSTKEALDMVKDAAKDATNAVAVNITFIGPDGSEIQPHDNAPVDISFSFGTPMSGEGQTLYHVDDSGSVDEMGSVDASATSVDFEATSFSTYVLVIKDNNSHNYENRTENFTFEGYQDITLGENWTETVGGKEVTIGGEWKINDAGKEILEFFEGEDTQPKGGTDPQSEPITIRLKTTGKAGDAVVTYDYEVGGKKYKDTFNIHIKGYTIHFNSNGASGKIEDQTVTMTAGGYALVQLPGQGEMSLDGYNFKGWGLVSDLLAKNRRYGWAYFTGVDGVSRQALYLADDGNEATNADTYRINASENKEEYTFYAQWAKQSSGNEKDKISFPIRKSNVIMTEPANYNAKDYHHVTGSDGGSGEIEVSNVSAYIGELSVEANPDRANARITEYAKQELEKYNEKHFKDTGKYFWNPETEKPFWYVIKRNTNAWHVDGIIVPKNSGTEETGGTAWVKYDTNCEDYSGQAPPSKQYDIGTDITIPKNNSFTLKRPGYTLTGWNTRKDGKGSGYVADDTFKLTKDTTLYAQWVPNGDTQYTLLGYDSETKEQIGTYTKVRRGVTGNTIEANDDDKTLSGYVFDEGNKKNVLQAHIKGDGSTTLVLWFKPNLSVSIVPVTTSKIYDGEEVTQRIDHLVVKEGSREETVSDFTMDGNNLTFHDPISNRDYTIKDVRVSITGGDRAIDAGTYSVVVDTSNASITKEGVHSEITTTGTGQITISKRPITITSGSYEGDYDGKAHKAESVKVTSTNPKVNKNPWVGNDRLPDLTYSVSVKAPTEAPVANVFRMTKNSTWEEEFPNYDITIQNGTLVVRSVKGKDTAFVVSIVPNSYRVTYNGTKQSVDKDAFTVEGVKETNARKSFLTSLLDGITKTDTRTFTINGEKYTLTGVSAFGEGTNVTTENNPYPVVMKGAATIKDSDGTDVTGQFSIYTPEGALFIDKRNVTLTSQSVTKEVYDGNVLRKEEVTVSGDGWADGDANDVEYTFTGVQKRPGTSRNTFTYTIKDHPEKLDNYNVTVVYGSLSIGEGKASYEVSVTPKGGSFDYDGAAHTVEGFENWTKEQGIHVTVGGHDYRILGLTTALATENGAQKTGDYTTARTDAGEDTITIVGTPRVLDEDDEDVTSEFRVKTDTTAKIIVNRKDLILQSATLSKQYDGNPLANPEGALVVESAEGVTVDSQGYATGFIEGESVSYQFADTASQTRVGETDNAFTVNWDNAKEGNYNVTKRFGKLRVVSREKKYDVTITGAGSGEDPDPADGSGSNPEGGSTDGTNPADSSGSAAGEAQGNVSGITYDGTVHTVSGFKEELTDKGLKVTAGGKDYYVTGVSSGASGKDAGEYETKLSYEEGATRATVRDADGNDVSEEFDVHYVPGKLVIGKADVTLQPASLSKPYDGKPLVNGTTALAVETGWAPGEGATYEFAGSQTLVGSSKNEIKQYTLKTNTNPENYNIKVSAGTLTVTNRGGEGDDGKFAITVTPESKEFTYDGRKHTVDSFTNQTDKGIEVTVDGVKYYVTGYTVHAEATDVLDSTSVNAVGTPVVTDEDGNVVTDQFAVTPQTGTITIKPRELTLHSASLSKKYDGTPLANTGDRLIVGEAAGVTLVEQGVESGFVEGESVSYSFSGSRTIPGSGYNAFTILWDHAKASNYTLKHEAEASYGRLTILPRDAKYEVTIHGKSDRVTYDGTAHTVSGFEEDDQKGRTAVTVEGQTYYVSNVISRRTATNVSESGETQLGDGQPVVKDKDGNDVSGEFAVTVLPGRLDIEEAKISLTSESFSKVYDGSALTNGNGKVTITQNGKSKIPEALLPKYEYTFTGSQTLIGSSPNSFTYKDVPNYKATPVFGTLTVTGKGKNEDGDETTIDPSRVVKKTHKGKDERIVRIGDQVDYTIEVTNVYANARTITVEELPGVVIEQSGSNTAVFENVPGGETILVKAQYVITEEDVLRGDGRFKNRVRVSFSDGNGGNEPGGNEPGGNEPGGNEPGGNEPGGNEPGGNEPGGTFEGEDDVIIEKPEPSIAITKRSDASTPKRVGETVNYVITVVNNGNVTANNVKVTDELTGDAWTIESLKTGASKTFEASYKIKESDVAVGKVVNKAKATGEPGGSTPGGNGGNPDGNGGNPDDNGGSPDGNGGNPDDNGGNPDGNGDVTDSTENMVEVSQTFNLVIHYVDEDGNPVAADYSQAYKYGDGFYVKSPEVSGYTPEFTFVSSDKNGMPAKDVDVTVKYYRNERIVGNGSDPESDKDGSNGGTDGDNKGNSSDNNDNGKTGGDKANHGGDSGVSTGRVDDNGGNGSNTGYSSDGDDDDEVVDEDGVRSGKSNKSGSGKKKERKGQNRTDAGLGEDGTTTGTTVTTPEVTNDRLRTRIGGGAGRTDYGSGADEDNGNGDPADRGGWITVDGNGKPHLVSADDTETPLMNLGLGDHACNILRLLILLVAFGFVIAHTRSMRRHQSRIFELREKLDDARKE